MPTPLYDTTWPVNFIEQKSMARRILDKAKLVAARKGTVFLRQLDRPTQEQWETAYVAQTGSALPIPVGVKLIWMDLDHGDARMFVTTKNGFSGQSSDGSVYEYIDMAYDRPSIRLLGYNDTTRFPHTYVGGLGGTGEPIRSIPAHFSKNQIVMGLNFNQTYYWAKQGLESFIIFYKLRSTGTVAPLRLMIFFNDSNTSDAPWQENYSNNPLLGIYGEINVTAAALGTDEDTFGASISGHIADANSLSNAYSEGVIFLKNWGQRTHIVNDEIEMADDTYAPGGVHYGSYMGSTAGTTNLYYQSGALLKVDEYHINQGFGNVGAGKTDDVTGEIWVYGLFKGLTGEFI